MKRILPFIIIAVCSLLLVQCRDDDNDNILNADVTCNDGILNGDEEGVDCGGAFCEPCEIVSGIDFLGTFIQEDQAGRPGTAKFYVSSGLRNSFNTTVPSQQHTFQENMENNILQLNPAYTVNFLNQDLLTFSAFISRDVLWVAQTGPVVYYDGNTILTGRRLQDDVMDFNLMLLYGGPDINNPQNNGTSGQPLLISDGVDANDKPFLSTFPYLAAPFQ